MTDQSPLPLVSVVIPVRNDPEHLRSCLTHLQASTFRDFEVLVVDDGSTDGTRAVAEELGSRLVPLGRQSGPAAARNRGVRLSRGAYIVFLDADVCVHPDTLGRLVGNLSRDAGVAAVFGSYDARPTAPNVVSQYRNLLHHFVHQTSSDQASTFWSGCGAIRRSLFEEAGGFDTVYRRPCIEDIELGQRLRAAGHRIVLDKDAQVTHLKRWTLWSVLKTDIRDRGLPWTQLILQRRGLPNTLNLRRSQRISVFLAGCLLAALGALAVLAAIGMAAAYWTVLPMLLLSSIVLANAGFYVFLTRVRGLLFAILTLPLHILYFWSCGVALGLGVTLFLWQTAFTSRILRSRHDRQPEPIRTPGGLEPFPAPRRIGYGDSPASI